MSDDVEVRLLELTTEHVATGWATLNTIRRRNRWAAIVARCYGLTKADVLDHCYKEARLNQPADEGSDK